MLNVMHLYGLGNRSYSYGKSVIRYQRFRGLNLRHFHSARISTQHYIYDATAALYCTREPQAQAILIIRNSKLFDGVRSRLPGT